MWLVVKYDKKHVGILKKELINITNQDLKLYIPKICIETYKRKKIFKKEINIMGDYIFCFHEKFSNNNFKNVLKFTKGLKYILDGCTENQKDISKFISKCQQSENSEGYISKNFYEIILNAEYKFLSGPFVNKIFKIVQLQKKTIKVLIDKIKINIKKEDFYFNPVN